MQFMLLMKGDVPVPEGDDAPPYPLPVELIDAMGRWNEELRAAGVMIASAGLFPSGMDAARVVYATGERTVVDGPFAEAKELVAGYTIIDVASRDEAIEWARRCPVQLAVPEGSDAEAVIEVRRIAASAGDAFPELAGR